MLKLFCVELKQQNYIVAQRELVDWLEKHLAYSISAQTPTVEVFINAASFFSFKCLLSLS
ncbi:hypothetical protein LguiA_024207 [Lonicera macranthoides]